jgi:hypothetical protein
MPPWVILVAGAFSVKSIKGALKERGSTRKGTARELKRIGFRQNFPCRLLGGFGASAYRLFPGDVA